MKTLFALFFFCSTLAMAQVSNVYPKPHEVEAGAVYKGKGNVIQGIIGKHKAVKKYKKQVPAKPESYYLHIDDRGNVIIAARDEQGLFYGQQTWLMISENGMLQECTIRDWPDVAWRGVVEGFYGQPWSHEDRMRQLFFYGQNKLNVYIYGPKDDPYHRDHWRDPYPEAEARQISELLLCAKANHVKFYWAIHPGVDIKWNDEDRDHLINKLESMYQLGVRSFAVFFDDIWGEGAKGDKQAALLNYIDDKFVKAKGDVSPLLLCPTEYNRAWSKDDSEYLHSLGTTLNKSVQVMWTGNSVVHCIDKESMEWINQRINRKAYIWWNFPVNDFVRDHILLGPAYGNGLDIAGDVSGFVSNPMQYAESSKLALFCIADYTWNMQAYDHQKTWERALTDLMPVNHESLRIFATYNQDLGPNGHGFRRDESPELKPVAEASLRGDREALGLLRKACDEYGLSADRLLHSQDNFPLKAELKPWLYMATHVSVYGKMICDMALDTSKVSEFYDKVKDLSRKMYDLETNKEVIHPYQTGIKTATLVLMPTLDRLFEQTITAYNQAHGTHLDAVAQYTPLHLTSTVPQLAQQPITLRGKEANVTPSNEIIIWAPDAHLLITSDQLLTLGGLDFNLGSPDQARNFRLEVIDGEGEWHPVSLCHYTEGELKVHTGNEINGMPCKALRLTNTSGTELRLGLKSFRFDIK